MSFGMNENQLQNVYSIRRRIAIAGSDVLRPGLFYNRFNRKDIFVSSRISFICIM